MDGGMDFVLWKDGYDMILTIAKLNKDRTSIVYK